jgi:hypothetical protein
MINALQHQHAEFFIHVDAKVPINEIRKCRFYNTTGITVIRNRYKISWGGYNMVRATLSLMKAVCKKKETGYLILLSGQDFPIKSPSYIYDFLKRNYGREYMRYLSLPDPTWNMNMNNGLDRIKYYWFVDTIGIEDSRILYRMQKENLGERNFFHELQPYGGSQWWCLTSECASYMLKFLQHNRVYEEYFEHCFIPDETFFNTLVLNSPFSKNTVNDNLKYIVWNQIGDASPRLLTMEDWSFIVGSECLWARKFYDQESSRLMDRLETHVAAVEFPA